ncbi:hypothetical protein XENTR_v10003784 [Xenopus tropicalis]|nr:hypothetical protein XENTR_v10003784 [Xenopus tropicalis]
METVWCCDCEQKKLWEEAGSGCCAVGCERGQTPFLLYLQNKVP